MAKSCLVGMVALVLSVMPASADVAGFYGNWENATKDATGIRHVAISPAGGNRVSVRVYGNCHPNECDWGMVPADSWPAGAKATDVKSVTAVIHYGFAHRKLFLRLDPQGGLFFDADFRFVPGSGKTDIHLAGRLRHSDWAGPMSKASWEQPLSRDVGWGGGARPALVRPKETCISFNPLALGLVRAGPGWNLVADGVFLTHTDWNQKMALRAVELIRHYKFNHKCHTGTIDFWRNNKTYPSEKLTGASCIAFHSTTAHVARIENTWRVVDGTQEISNLKNSKDNALALVAMIRFHKLENKCVLAWPNPILTYWLTHNPGE